MFPSDRGFEKESFEGDSVHGNSLISCWTSIFLSFQVWNHTFLNSEFPIFQLLTSLTCWFYKNQILNFVNKSLQLHKFEKIAFTKSNFVQKVHSFTEIKFFLIKDDNIVTGVWSRNHNVDFSIVNSRLVLSSKFQDRRCFSSLQEWNSYFISNGSFNYNMKTWTSRFNFFCSISLGVHCQFLKFSSQVGEQKVSELTN